ncbi:MAG: AAA family ATPase [Bacteroidales bacterium]|nr:AAA family ATPase [Bacteroidales bacterium]
MNDSSKNIIRELIDATVQERNRIEEPKNRSRYFIFDKVNEKLEESVYTVVYANAPERVFKDVSWAIRKDDELLFRIGDFFLPAKAGISNYGLIIKFDISDISKSGIDIPILKDATNYGIEYIMDNRELIDYLINFLRSKSEVINPFIYYLFQKKDVEVLPNKITFKDNRLLNESQINAINKSLSQNVTFIWGPPGTGKTITLGSLAAFLIQNNRRVLLSALSNKALDQLLIKTVEQLKFNLKSISVARCGSTMDDEVRGFSRDSFSNFQFESKKAGTNWSRHVRNSNLVAANFTMLTFPRSADPGFFDCVIADEVSMANIPSIIATSYFAKKYFIVGGDPRQLPPIYPEDADEPNMYFRDNIFQIAKINNAEDPRAAFLDTQYRMHKEISNLVSDIFYKDFGGLHTGIDFSKDNEKFKNRIIFIHSPGSVGLFGSDYFESEDQRRFNTKHSESIVRIFMVILKKGYPPEDIGIIAPYNAQVVQIESDLIKTCKKYKINYHDIKISTVHSFQGQERKVIIMDITDDNINPSNLTAKWQLINVALSRAKEQLFIIGNYKYLINKEYFSDNEILLFKKILKHSKIMTLKES